MKLEAINVSRRAGDQWLLRDISLTIRSGQCRAVTGPSGSGKSLLLRALALLDPLAGGEIRWGDQIPRRREIPVFRSRVIYLHQRPSLREGTVEENCRFLFSMNVHQAKRFERKRLVQWLDALGRTEAFLSKPIAQLSGGELQLTAIMRAIQLDPNVLLLDEPTAALDAAATSAVETLIKQWLDADPGQRALLWVTHDRDQASRIATNMLRIAAGKLEEAS